MPQQSKKNEDNFWQASTCVPLATSDLEPGFLRIEITTARPVYAELVLVYEGASHPFYVQSFDILTSTHCSMLLRLNNRCSDAYVAITPPVERNEDIKLTVRKAGFFPLTIFGARKIFSNLLSPKTLLAKLHSVISSGSNLRFRPAGQAGLDEEAGYALWQQIFEPPPEIERMRMALISICRKRKPPIVLVVFSTASKAHAAFNELLNTFGKRSGSSVEPVCEIRLLVIENAGSPLTPSLRDRLGSLGAEIIEAVTEYISLQAVSAAAKRHAADMFVFLERSGRFSPWAFDAFALELLRHPESLMVYADSDRIDEAGKRSEPSFKPEWSPEYFLGYTYTGAAIAFRPAILNRNGIPPQVRPGAAVFTLALDAITPDLASGVRRIPRVLFHEFQDREERTGCETRARQEREALQERIDKMPGQQRPSLAPFDKARSCERTLLYPLPTPAPRVSVILLTRNSPGLLRDSAGSVLDADYPNCELIIIDNGSDDPDQKELLQTLSEQNGVTIIEHSSPFNYSALNNIGRLTATGDVLLFLNDDTKALDRRWISELTSLSVLPDVGCVGALLLYEDGSVQHAGVTLGIGGLAGHAFRNLRPDDHRAGHRLHLRHETSAVTGACLAIRASVFDEVGGFDENLAVALNDIDLCLKVKRKGYRNLFTPYAVLTHYESATRGMDTSPERLARLARESAIFFRTWGPSILNDPCYSPHLTRNAEDYGPRFAG